MIKRMTSFAAVLCLLLNTAFAQQISVSSLSQTYFENFDGLATSGTTNTTLPNAWYTSVANYRAGDGSTNNGALYSFGEGTNTDRSIGSIGSSSVVPSFGVKFVNNTGASITKINLNFITELWRLGQKPSLRLDSTIFSYNVGVESLTAATGWTNVAALNLITPDTSTVVPSAGGKINGNIAPNRKLVNGSIEGLSIADGATFWLRWTEINVSGNDDGLALDSLTVTFEGGVLPNCIEPAASVTNVSLNAINTTTVSGSFTGTSPASSGYLVLLDSNATAPVITDATAYTVGDAVGTATVISNGTSLTFTKSGLVSNTIYHVYVYPYNNSSCTGGPNYKTSAPGTESARTLVDACPEPANTPTNLTFTAVGNNNIDGKFNRSNPTADGYVVVFSLSSNIAYPLDSATYNIGDSIIYSSFKSKIADISSSALDTTFSITGLVQGTKYYVAVIPYNLCGGFKNFKRSASNGVNRDDTTTAGTPPLTDCVQPTGVSSTTITNVDSTTSTISIKWRNSANGDSVLVFAAPTNTIGNVTLRDSIYYMVGSTVPSNGTTPPKVFYRGTDSACILTGLLTNTVYKIFVVAFNNKGCINGPNYGGLANTLIRSAAGTDCQNPTGVSTTTIVKLDSTATTISVKWTNPVNADSVMVIAAPITVGFITIRDSVNYPVNAMITSSTSTSAKVYYRGTDSSYTLTGLTPNTVYKLFFVTFRNKNCTYGPNYSGAATTTIRTALSTGVKFRSTEAAFSLFPNPAKDGMLYVKFDNSLREDAVMQVLDVLGRNVYAEEVPAFTQMKPISVSNLAKGTYFLNVVYQGTNNVSTFIVE